MFASDTLLYAADDTNGLVKYTTTNAATLAGPWTAAYTIKAGGKGTRGITGRYESASDTFVLYVVTSAASANALYRYDTGSEPTGTTAGTFMLLTTAAVSTQVRGGYGRGIGPAWR